MCSSERERIPCPQIPARPDGKPVAAHSLTEIEEAIAVYTNKLPRSKLRGIPSGEFVFCFHPRDKLRDISARNKPRVEEVIDRDPNLP